MNNLNDNLYIYLFHHNLQCDGKSPIKPVRLNKVGDSPKRKKKEKLKNRKRKVNSSIYNDEIIELTLLEINNVNKQS